MNIAHFSDLHYCPKHLEEVDRCFRQGIRDFRLWLNNYDGPISNGMAPHCAVISGDLTDHRVEFHSPTVHRLLAAVQELASFTPVLVLQGTYSHDPRGMVSVFRSLKTQCPIYVADRIGQVCYSRAGGGWGDGFLDYQIDCLFSCLPSIDKGQVAAAAGAENAGDAAGEAVDQLMHAWASTNSELAALHQIPTVVVSHGTVAAAVTEHGVPMAGFDHEFSAASLFASKANAVMLGHIHKHQTWTNEEGGQVIAYPGSIGRLHHGEIGDKGWILWHVGPGTTTLEFMPVDAQRFLDLEWNEEENPETLAMWDVFKYDLLEAKGAHVRVRWTTTEEDRHLVDTDQLRAGILEAGALTVQLEPTVVINTRVRVDGMSKQPGVRAKLDLWAADQGEDFDPLADLLALLEEKTPDQILEGYIDSTTVDPEGVHRDSGGAG